MEIPDRIENLPKALKITLPLPAPVSEAVEIFASTVMSPLPAPVLPVAMVTVPPLANGLRNTGRGYKRCCCGIGL